jgi:hypothetical protein
MPTLGQVGEVITEQLRERVERLVSAVESDTPDFGEIATVADAVGELADTIADLYTDLERRLLSGLEANGDGGNGDAQESPARKPRRRRQQPQRTQAEPEPESVTKEELLEQARELHVEGRSSMTKDELAEAVEAGESVTKEELLERARDAHIDGRSSMTKEELREALHEAGA